jgi:multicomponent Na+:H+ antiporter subunit F
MNVILITMILSLFIPIYQTWSNDNIWEKMLAVSSISSKISIIILVISVLRDDVMMAVTGVIIITIGNAGLMLLAHLCKRIMDKGQS